MQEVIDAIELVVGIRCWKGGAREYMKKGIYNIGDRYGGIYDHKEALLTVL